MLARSYIWHFRVFSRLIGPSDWPFDRVSRRAAVTAVTPEQMLAAETARLDIRFHAGAVDASELPSSYKRAGAVTEQIRAFGLADVVDCIDPYGCIMAGDSPPPWQKGNRARR